MLDFFRHRVIAAQPALLLFTVLRHGEGMVRAQRRMVGRCLGLFMGLMIPASANPTIVPLWGPVVDGLQCGLVADWDGTGEPRFTVLLKNHSDRVLSMPAPATFVRQDEGKAEEPRRFSQPFHPEVRLAGEGAFWVQTQAGISSETLAQTILQIPPGETAEITQQPLEVSSWSPDRPDYQGRVSLSRTILGRGGVYHVRLVFRSRQSSLGRTRLWRGAAPSGWITLHIP